MKCYRNVQTLIEELEKKTETVELGQSSMNAVKGYFKAILILTAVNLAGVAGIAAHLLGVF